MKKIIPLLIILFLTSCASWHLNYIDNNLNILCKKCITGSNSSTTDSSFTIANPEPLSNNDSLFLAYLQNCFKLSNYYLDSIDKQSVVIKDLALKIQTKQPQIEPLVNPMLQKEIIHIRDSIFVVNPINEDMKIQIAKLVSDNAAKDKTIESKHIGLNIWRWIALICGWLIILVIVLKLMKFI